MNTIEDKKTVDPIIAEIWAVKDALAKKHNYNLRSLYEQSRKYAEQMKKEGYKFVTAPKEEQVPTKQTGTGNKR